jgi:hypothetical protein
MQVLPTTYVSKVPQTITTVNTTPLVGGVTYTSGSPILSGSTIIGQGVKISYATVPLSRNFTSGPLVVGSTVEPQPIGVTYTTEIPTTTTYTSALPTNDITDIPTPPYTTCIPVVSGTIYTTDPVT